jgi:tetratricopeptide (TPR) repeat protein
MKQCPECKESLGESVRIGPVRGAAAPPSRARAGRFVLLVLLAVGMATQALAGAAFDDRQAAFWVAKYGRADEADAVTRRARTVFSKVFAAAEKPGVLQRRPDEVLVIVDPRSREIPLYALPDGHVILGHRVARECFAGVPEEVGDARLAYVLGHELAHLALRHALDDNILMGLTPDASARAYLELQTKGETLRRELHADDRGFLYAMLAGFPSAPLVRPMGDFDSFWQWWDETFGAQPASLGSSTHPDSHARVEVLRQRADAVRQIVLWYDAGVRLALSGRLDIARELLEGYAAEFPSSDAYNALGLLHLREAAAAGALFTRVAVVDADSQASLVTISAERDLAPADPVRRALEAATERFRAALRINPAHLPAAINLVTALEALGPDGEWEAKMELERLRRRDLDEATRSLLDRLLAAGQSPPAGTASATPAPLAAFLPEPALDRLEGIARAWPHGAPLPSEPRPAGWQAVPLPRSLGLAAALSPVRATAYAHDDGTSSILFFTTQAANGISQQMLAMVTLGDTGAASATPSVLPDGLALAATPDGALFGNEASGIRIRADVPADAWRVGPVQRISTPNNREK